MWRFILLSFAFMGFAFYELSGGADYTPRADSLQVALRDTGIFATPVPFVPHISQVAAKDAGTLPPPIVPRTHEVAELPRTTAVTPSAEDEAVSRALGSLASLSTVSMDSFGATLANTPGSFDVDPVLGLSGDILGQDADLANLRIDLGTAPQDSMTQDPMAQETMAPPDPADIRRVAGDLVNMRAGPGTDYQQLAQVTGGTPVEVLETADNGWVRLRTLDSGNEGWMADWLVTASN